MPIVNQNARPHIEKILANLTQLPGVYKMLGRGELLYVGKAKNLKIGCRVILLKPLSTRKLKL